MTYKDLRATINPYPNRRSRKIKQYSKHLYINVAELESQFGLEDCLALINEVAFTFNGTIACKLLLYSC